MSTWSREDLWGFYVEEEINNYKQIALESLKTIVDPRFADKLLPLISYCFQEEFPEAQYIFDHLKLEEMHSVAGLDNRDLFSVLLQDVDNDRKASEQLFEQEYEDIYA